MADDKIDIYVYAGWISTQDPPLLGVLSARQGNMRKTFSFHYDDAWLNKQSPFMLDPDISWNSGRQFPVGKNIFGVFNDAMPDTWGRTLMKRREALFAREEKRTPKNLYEIDFLLGVNDEGRMGALRFKLQPDGPFLNNEKNYPTPPWSSVRELQHGISLIESDKDNKEVRKWLQILMAPGSSLGGARPKANVVDSKGNLWIAKFPSKEDSIDKAAWEYLAYKLAIKAGIEMSPCKIEKISGKHHAFFTQRFDREKNKRIHFASAMTLTGYNEDTLKEKQAGYLDIAEFIQFNEANNRKELKQLWRRMVFNMAVSNTDDHLRNHGFLLRADGWALSPAYDINPSIDKEGLALTVDGSSNALDPELAKSVGQYFQLSTKEMDKILKDISSATKTWKIEATRIGISRAGQQLMAGAFRFLDYKT